MAFTPARLPFYLPSLPIQEHTQVSPTLTNLGTVPARILVLSDTHNTALFPPNDRNHAFKAPLPRADVVLYAGDLSNSGKMQQYAVTFRVLGSIEAELKLVIAGNHDLTLDADYWRGVNLSEGRGTSRKAKRTEMSEEEKAAVEDQIQRVREMWTGEETRKNGIRYLEEGVHEFELSNGAKFTVYASPYSPKFWDWAFMTAHSEDRYNPPWPPTSLFSSASAPANPIPSHPAIDLVMTHGPPAEVLDRTKTHNHAGCGHLLRALARVRPRLHVFGHIHEDWGAMRVDWSVPRGECVNLTGRRNTFDEEGEEDDETWMAVKERGYVAVDLTGSNALGAVTKGRKNAGAEKEAAKEGAETVLSLPPLQWGTETLCVNAAIMSGRFKPENAPILVDLMLPARTGD